MSLISGTFVKVISWSVRRVAHSIGKTAFLFPDGLMVPEIGLPPRISKSDMVCILYTVLSLIFDEVQGDE